MNPPESLIWTPVWTPLWVCEHHEGKCAGKHPLGPLTDRCPSPEGTASSQTGGVAAPEPSCFDSHPAGPCRSLCHWQMILQCLLFSWRPWCLWDYQIAWRTQSPASGRGHYSLPWHPVKGGSNHQHQCDLGRPAALRWPGGNKGRRDKKPANSASKNKTKLFLLKHPSCFQK